MQENEKPSLTAKLKEVIFAHKHWISLYRFMHRNAKFLVPLIFIIPFYAKIENAFTTYITLPHLLIQKANWTLELWFYVLLIAIIGHAVYKYKMRTLHSYPQLLFTIILAGGYLFYRTHENPPYYFLRILSFPRVAYLDILPFYAAISIVWNMSAICRYYCKRNSEKPDYHGFLYDEPIADANDSLGRKEFAKQLANKLKKTRSDHSAFAMGLVGEWGSGKTSFWRLMKAYLESEPENGTDDRDTRIIFEYSPWQNHGSSNIIKDFFAKLSYELQPFDSSFGRHIDTYSKLLMQADDSKLNSFIKPFRSLFFPVRTVQNEYELINKKLKAIDKQVIIFIDDLDRLDKTEILEVIRLIRNSANFANTIFVTAYDRNYLIKAIEEFNGYNKEAFLEKIFQLEVPLPRYEPEKIKEALLTEFKKFLDAEDYKQLCTHIYRSVDDPETIDVSYLKTLREVVRFANSFRESYECLKEITDLKDLFYVELLKTKYLGVYILIFDGDEKFLQKNYGTAIQGIPWNYLSLSIHKTTEKAELNRIAKNKQEKDVENEKNKSLYIERYLHEHADNFGVSAYQIDDAVALLDKIFRKNTSSYFTLKSVREPAGFYRYCYNRLSTNNISENDYKKAKGQGIESFKQEIDKWITNNKSKNELAIHLFFHNNPADIDEFKLLTEARYYFARIEANASINNENPYVETLLSSLANHQKAKNKKIFEHDNQYKEYLKSLIGNQFPYLFDIDLFSEAIKDPSKIKNFPFNYEEITKMEIELFEKHINGCKTLLEALRCSYEYPRGTREKNNQLTPKTKPIFLAFLQKRIDEDNLLFMQESIKEERDWMKNEIQYYLYLNIAEAFGGIDALISFLASKDAFSSETGQKYEAFLTDLIKYSGNRVDYHPFQ